MVRPAHVLTCTALAVLGACAGPPHRGSPPTGHYRLALPPVRNHIVVGAGPYHWLYHLHRSLFEIPKIADDFTPDQKAEIICALATRVAPGETATVELIPTNTAPLRFGLKLEARAGTQKILTLHTGFNILHRRAMLANDPEQERWVETWTVDGSRISSSYNRLEPGDAGEVEPDPAEYLDTGPRNLFESRRKLSAIARRADTPLKVRIRSFLTLGRVELILDDPDGAANALLGASFYTRRIENGEQRAAARRQVDRFAVETRMYPRVRECIQSDNESYEFTPGYPEQ